MLFVQHIAKSTPIKFLCVTWAFLLAYNPNTNINTVRNTNIYLHEVIVRVRWKGVPTCVQPKGRSPRHREVESYVGGLLRWTRYIMNLSLGTKLDIYVQHIYRIWLSYLIAYFVEELDVEVSKWRDGHCKLFTQSHLIYDWILISWVWNG